MNKLIFFRVPLEFLTKDQIEFIERSQITSRCDNEVSMDSQTTTAQTQVSRPSNTSLSNAVPTNRLNNGNQLECPECGKILRYNFQLKRHLFFHRDKSKWPFECQICKEKAQTKCDMSKHYLSGSHEKDPRFVL